MTILDRAENPGRLALAVALSVCLTGAPSAFAQQGSAPAGEPPPPAAEPAEPEASAEDKAVGGAGAPLPPLSESLTGQAAAEYEAGRLLYQDGDYAGAVLKFEQAYELSKDPRLLWNMAACEKNLRRYAHTLQLLTRYAQEGAGILTAEDLEDAAELKQAIRPFVGTLALVVNEPGATIYVDDAKVGTTPLEAPLQLDMGVRRIRIEKPGFEPYVGEESLRGGQETTLTIDLQQEVTAGTLVVHAGANDTVRVDGKVVGTGTWRGTLPAGVHGVSVTAPGMRPYEGDVAVQRGQTSTLRIKLEAEPVAADTSGVPAWVWVTGGVVLAGAGAGGYFLLRSDRSADPVAGTLQPGVVHLPLMR